MQASGLAPLFAAIDQNNLQLTREIYSVGNYSPEQMLKLKAHAEKNLENLKNEIDMPNVVGWKSNISRLLISVPLSMFLTFKLYGYRNFYEYGKDAKGFPTYLAIFVLLYRGSEMMQTNLIAHRRASAVKKATEICELFNDKNPAAAA